MRIGINALAVSPERPGGDGTYVRALVERLPRLAADDEWIVFILPGSERLFPPARPNLRYVPCRVPGGSVVARALWEQIAMPRWLALARPDVIHAPVNVAPLAAAAPVVLTVHEAEPFMPKSGIPAPLLVWWRITRRLSMRRAARIVTVSKAARADIMRWAGPPAAPIQVVPLGVDHGRFGPRPAAYPAPLDGQPYLLWVGRPYPSKNLERLIDAFDHVRRAGRTELLVLAGPRGWAERELMARVRWRGCGHAVIRRPPLAGELADWYRGARLLAFPSLRESFGLPVLEAMACETPVVAADLPALREVGADAPVYVDPLDAGAIAEGLMAALANCPLRHQLRERGAQRARAFTWQATVEQTYAVYRSLVGG